MYEIPIIYLLLPLYSIAVLLTYLSSEDFVGVAWDSAGVTTGPSKKKFLLFAFLSLLFIYVFFFFLMSAHFEKRVEREEQKKKIEI